MSNSGLVFDPTISIGQIANAVIFLVTLVVAWTALRNRVATLSEDMVGVQRALEQLAHTTIALARVEERLRALERLEDWSRERERARAQRDESADGK